LKKEGIMDFSQIKNDYLSGVSVPELSRRYSISQGRIRYRARRENWRGEESLPTLRSAVFSTARLLLSVSKASEQALADGGKLDTRDVKYLTAAEKELLEVIKSIDGSDEEPTATREKEIPISSSSAAGVIFIPSVLSGEA
jgi:hypothetical protein